MDFTQFAALIKPDDLQGSLLTLVVMVVMSIVFWIISNFTKKPIELGFGSFKITFGKEEDKEKTHSKCNAIAMERFKNFIVTKEKQIAKLNNEVFERQMNFCDDKIQVIRDMFMDEYVVLLSKKLESNSDPRVHSTFRNYMTMVDLMLNTAIKDQTFKKSMKQNHLLDLNLDTWESFIDDKVHLTFSLMKRFYDENYPDESLVTRHEVDESNDRLFEKIRPTIVSMYRKARVITVEIKEKINSVQKEIDAGCSSDSFTLICVEDEDDES